MIDDLRQSHYELKDQTMHLRHSSRVIDKYKINLKSSCTSCIEFQTKEKHRSQHWPFRRLKPLHANTIPIPGAGRQTLRAFLPPPAPLEPRLPPPPGPGEPKIQQSIPVASTPPRENLRSSPALPEHKVLPWPYGGEAPWLGFTFNGNSNCGPREGQQEGEEAAVPLSPKTTTPPRPRFWLPNIFNGFGRLSAEPDDENPTPTQADFLPYLAQYHPGENSFLSLPYPADFAARGVLPMPMPWEDVIPREKRSANIWPPEMLSPYPHPGWESDIGREDWELGAPIRGGGGVRVSSEWQAQLPVRGVGGGI